MKTCISNVSKRIKNAFFGVRNKLVVIFSILSIFETFAATSAPIFLDWAKTWNFKTEIYLVRLFII